MSEPTQQIEEEQAEELKSLNDVNLQALADDIAEVFSKNVGGVFNVVVTKFEHTNPNNAFQDRIILHMAVEDESWPSRKDFNRRSRVTEF
jgi:hypothetical protein